jgi:hypothetical protein
MTIENDPNNRARERRLRRLAQQYGLRLEKCRIRTLQARGYGGYRLFDVQHQAVAYGGIPYAYCATLDNIEHFLTQLPSRPPPYSADEVGGSHEGL